jgi:hypothetical protein
MRQQCEENAKLKRLVADLTLDNAQVPKKSDTQDCEFFGKIRSEGVERSVCTDRRLSTASRPVL